MNLTASWIGYACLGVFVIAYALVMAEELMRLRKSVPVIVAAGVVWVLIGIADAGAGSRHAAEAFRHNLLEFAELFLFLLAAMTYINTMEERQVFDALRNWLIGRKLSLRAVFWATGALAFCISPFADNLTTALVMGAVAISVGSGNPRFVTVACINVVVAANSGGAFSPFGDITTLMVWQKGVVSFTEFFDLLIPSLVTWLVPAAIMATTVDRGRPTGEHGTVRLRPGARGVVALFVATIAGTVVMHNFLHLPPVLGMMTGLGALKVYSFLLQRRSDADRQAILSGFEPTRDPNDTFDVYGALEKIEWDTLMFFYGVILCVGGLGAIGYLSLASHAMYGGLGPTVANSLVGVLSAIVDNIPVMFAVLTMNPAMSHNEWLLVTLTAGTGGSLLSIGSAAGVALMGQARGTYTFLSHLRWTWAVALGYLAGIGTHLLINGR